MSQVEKTKENLQACNCLKCPSYTTSCKIKEMPHNMIDMLKGIENVEGLENLFCAYTKSRCIDEDKGCLYRPFCGFILQAPLKTYIIKNIGGI